MESFYNFEEIAEAFEAKAKDGHYQKLRKYCLHHDITDEVLFEILDLIYGTEENITIN